MKSSNSFCYQPRRHAGCICPPEFTGEHCELLDYEGFDPAAHQRANNNTKQSGSIGAFSVVLVCAGSLCVVLGAAMLYRKRREYRRNSVFGNIQGDTLALSTLPQPPQPTQEQSKFYTEDAYTDDEFVDPYNREVSDSDDDGEFHDVLPEIL